jgi:hypothetical protein
MALDPGTIDRRIADECAAGNDRLREALTAYSRTARRVIRSECALPQSRSRPSIAIQALQGFVWVVSRALRQGSRIEIQLRAMEVDGHAEPITIAETTRHGFHSLNLGVDRL